MRLIIYKSQIDHLTDTGVWIKLPNGSEMFWLSNKCFYPRKDTASIYLRKEYIYLVRRRTKTAVSFEDYGDRIIDLLKKVVINYYIKNHVRNVHKYIIFLKKSRQKK